MAFIELERVTKRFGGITAVDALDLAVDAGEFLTVLGLSGCGKTTVLRMIAGLEIPDSGEIRIEGRKVFSTRDGVFVPAGKRNVGLVFQSYALWPHMTVFENVAFGLRVRHVDRRTMTERVGEALAYMRLEDLGDRYPQQLSGGQQQRVALARMLVTRPGLFLMDEPLSNLDAKLRMEMRSEIKRLHRENRATTIYVTHDQHEALTLSTHVAVMKQGVIQQLAPPRTIYRKPASLFIADFIGSPAINFMRGRIDRMQGALAFHGDGVELFLPAGSGVAGQAVVAAVRSEDIRLVRATEVGAMTAEIDSVLPAGADVILKVRKAKTVLTVKQTGDFIGEVGEPVYFRIPPEAINLYDPETGLLLGGQ
ncbi:MAG: ABC transporter ATP-binding protein [Hyphomicrobiales bacterium]